MLRALSLVVLLAFTGTASAQDTISDLDPALAPLARLVGQWEGEAIAMTQQGRKVMVQTEDVRVDLGGKVIVVEGTGREDGVIAFNAFGLFSIDGETGEIWFDAFTQENRHTRVQPTITEDGFDWSIEPERGPKIHYTMRFDEAGRWVETGRYSMDGGTTWTEFFEMTLSRVEV